VFITTVNPYKSCDIPSYESFLDNSYDVFVKPCILNKSFAKGREIRLVIDDNLPILIEILFVGHRPNQGNDSINNPIIMTFFSSD